MADTDTALKQGVTVKDLLDAGLHFGHQTRRWNPKMKPYIFGKRNGIHIIDLTKSHACLQAACRFVEEVAAGGRTVLFIGTKKQAQQVVRETASETRQHFVTHRWLGGTLTNMQTIQTSIKRMREIAALEKDGMVGIPKQEQARLRHEYNKLDRNLCGVADMTRLPAAVFVIDINREANAVSEAQRLKIPVIAIVDTNCNPDAVTYVIPGNDDAMRGIMLITRALGAAIKQGTERFALTASESAKRRQAEAAAEQPSTGTEAAATETTGEGAARKPVRPRTRAKKPAAESPAPEAPAAG